LQRQGRTVAVAMPGRDRLPEGPLRELVRALHDLYRAAGKPSTRRVSAEIRKRDDLPDTVSHETVSAMLRGDAIPQWPKIQSLVLYLAAASVTRRDPEAELLRFHELWLAAEDARQHSAGQQPRGPGRLPDGGAMTHRAESLRPHGGDPDPLGPLLGRATPSILGVPPRNPRFTGRRALLSKLHTALTHRSASAPLPVVIHGLGGVGKTQLAIEYLHRHGEHYDVVWWIPAEQPSQIRASLAMLGARLRLPASQDMRHTAQAVLDALQSGHLRWLLVYDNANQPRDIGPLVPPGGGGVLLTSRNSVWPAAWTVMEIDVLERDESIELLQRRNRAIPVADADRLAAKLGDLPLALEQAASWQVATGTPVAEYVRMLDDHVRELLSQGRPDDYPATFAALLDLAVERLRTAAPNAYLLLELFAFLGAEPLSIRLLRASRVGTAAADHADVLYHPILRHRAIRELRRFGLVRENPKEDSIQVHRLVQQLLRSSLPADRRVRCKAVVQELIAGANPHEPENPANWPRYAEIGPHIAPADLVNATRTDLRWLVLDHVRYLSGIGDYDGSRQLAEVAVTAWSRPPGSGGLGADHEMTLIAMRQLAIALRRLGDNDRARLLSEEVYERLRRHPHFGEDHEHTLLAANSVAVGLRIAGEFERARDLDNDILRRHIRVFGEDDDNTLRMRNNVAVNLRLLGAYSAAFQIDREVAARYEESLDRDDPRLLLSLINLGLDLYGLGSYADVLRIHDQVLAQFSKQLTPRQSEILLAARLGAMAMRKAGRYADALAHSRKNFVNCQRWYGPDHQHALAAATTYVNCLRASGEITAARRLATDTRDGYGRVFGERHPFTLAAQVNLGIVLRAAGDAEAAGRLDGGTEATMRRILGRRHPYTICVSANLATDHSLLGRLDDALTFSHRAWDDFRNTWGEDHPYSLGCAVNAAFDLGASGDATHAAAMLERGVTSLADQLGENHPEVQAVRRGGRAEFDVEPPPT
jgi:hypothetical protein